VARPRITPPAPPTTYIPDPRAARIVSDIRDLAAGTGAASDLPVADRSLAIHYINHMAAVIFTQVLDEEKESGPSWAELGRRHGMAGNSLQWRVAVHRGTVPQKWAAGVRKTKQT
jgi:hypothetical protein